MAYFLRYTSDELRDMEKQISYHQTDIKEDERDGYKFRDDFDTWIEYRDDEREEAPQWWQDGEFEIVEGYVLQTLEGLCGFEVDDDIEDDDEAIEEAKDMMSCHKDGYTPCADGEKAVLFEGEFISYAPDGAIFSPSRIVKVWINE